ncbi:MAG: hypothetical protein PHD61_09100 [Bacteroidales bacterium]|nr:hypothetical protein [Lentimicrobiaceae bacterium]MDD5695442.1 hypothetical protein [Bacteroidales bacterium]
MKFLLSITCIFYIRYLTLLLGFIAMIVSCKKDDEPRFIDEPSDEVVKYQVFLACGPMIETYTPCYHLNSPGEVIRIVKTTIFEYDLR